MTAVDHAELKRLAEGVAGLPETDLGDSFIEARRDWQAVCDAFRKAASAYVVLELLTEIEALESELEATKINEGIWFDIANERRTQAPDSWRPDMEEAARIVSCHLTDAPDTVCIPITITAGDLRTIYAALRPQTAESGK